MSTKQEFAETLSRLLPMNRKERFFTGSVLPGLLAENQLSNLGIFTNLCGLPGDPLAAVAPSGIQVWSEYGFAESVFRAHDRDRFEGFSRARDTPDVVIVGPDWLVAVEAKMYDWPDRGALRTQLLRQKDLVDYWTERLSFSPQRVKHVALLPRGYVDEAKPGLEQTTLTWEEVAEAYRHFGSSYWLDVLDVALEQWDALVSKTRHLQFGGNSDAVMTGADIVAQHRAGTLTFSFMGRQGGLDGPGVSADLASGGWAGRQYEVRRTELSAPNWFPVADFVGRLDASQL